MAHFYSQNSIVMYLNPVRLRQTVICKQSIYKQLSRFLYLFSPLQGLVIFQWLLIGYKYCMAGDEIKFSSSQWLKPGPNRCLAVLNAFPTLYHVLFKLKHSWNAHQTFILLIVTVRDCYNSHDPLFTNCA
jgi:hypothetical protein